MKIKLMLNVLLAAVGGLAMLPTWASNAWVALGASHTCGITGGTVKCWGAGNLLGNGSTVNKTIPVSTSALSNVTQVTAGVNHSCGLKADGTLWCWGQNLSGELGIGNYTSSLVPMQVTALGNQSIAVASQSASQYSCALKSDGTVWCWGYLVLNNVPPLYSRENIPVQIAALGNNVIDVQVGGDHACAVKSDKSLWCWGDNNFGQLGQGNTNEAQVTADIPKPVRVSLWADVSALALGSAHTCATRGSAGDLWCWGASASGQLGGGIAIMNSNQLSPLQITGFSGVTKLVAGGFHTCAQKNDGTTWCWGRNDQGQLGVGNTTQQNSPMQLSTLPPNSVVDIGTGNLHTCVLKTDFTVQCWGNNDSGQLGNKQRILEALTPTNAALTSILPGATNAAALLAGPSHTCVSTTGGNMACWGANTAGQLGRGNLSPGNGMPLPVLVAAGSQLTNVANAPTGIALGELHTCAAANGGVWCWGRNLEGQLGLGSGNLLEQPFPKQISAFAASIITAGGRQSCATQANLSVWCWGKNSDGQLGVGDKINKFDPTQLTAFTTSVAPIAMGQNHACTLKNSEMWCWGDNSGGQLGTGDNVPSISPKQIPTLANVKSIYASYYFTCALNYSDNVFCWGQNFSGQLGLGDTTTRNSPSSTPTLTNVVSLALGISHVCALKTDTTVWCWGSNTTGQLGLSDTVQRTLPVQIPNLANVVSLAAGSSHTCAKLNDNKTIKCWGSNKSGQLGVGDNPYEVAPGVNAEFFDGIFRNFFE